MSSTDAAPGHDALSFELIRIGFERAPFGISLTSAEPASFGRYIIANAAYRSIIGYREEQLAGMAFSQIVHPDETAEALESARRLLAGAEAVDVETALLRADGSTVWVRQHRTLVRDAEARPRFFFTHTEDLSRRKADEAALFVVRRIAEEALRDSESRYRLLAEYAGDMIVRTRADRTRAYVSPASRTLLGYEPDELMGLDFALALHPADRARVAAEYETFLARGGRTTCTYRLRRKDGTYVWVESAWVGATTSGKAGEVVAVVRDISERKAAEAQVVYMASHDVLTGLANRSLFNERLDEALDRVARDGSAAVLCIDLDDFKSVNDTFGHAVGDGLLKSVARRLVASVRERDTVARLGGDEFAIVQSPLHGFDEAAALAARIVDVLGRPYEIDGHRVTSGASVGIALAPQNGTRSEALLKSADIALYRAKADGRATYRFFEADMNAHVEARRALEGQMRTALARGEYELYYQPIIDLRTRALAGFEALVRWRHPERGLVLPGEFIPIAEENGFINTLGAWVLRQACLEGTTWPSQLKVAVNLSPVQFTSRDLAATITEIVGATRLSPRRLELEITESILLRDAAIVGDVLAALRATGIAISFDDFGIGYSSLGYLRDYPFDKLKIDKSFVQGLGEAGASAAIVRSISALGRELRITTVAEGIETSDQLAQMEAFGCLQGQGYFLGVPQPAGELRALVDALAPFAAG